MPVVIATTPWEKVPAWALLQRRVIADLSASVRPFWEKYVAADGSLRWGGTGAQHGRDDKDDFYEAFYNWPLLYLLGGDDELLTLSHAAWEGVTRQLTGLGLLEREYDTGADFFHQGEGLTFFYNLCMADPDNPALIERATRFADFYTGADPAVPNYDPEQRIIRAPHTGSRGPLPGYRDGDPAPDWPAGMRVYGLPFDDVPGVEEFDALADPALARRFGEVMQIRFGEGDVVSNLGATSLVANAYLMTGDTTYRDWVDEYTTAWLERAAANGGIVPDNVGLDGEVGQRFDGRWFGGLYGWSWPHGFYNISQSTAIAGMNAFLLTGQAKFLDLPRWQYEAVLRLARQADVRQLEMSLQHHWLPHLGFGSSGALERAPTPVTTMVVPYRHGCAGWFDWQPLLPTVPAALWTLSQSPADRARLDLLREQDGADWARIARGRTKEDAGHEAPWLLFLSGELPTFPEAILEAALATTADRLRQIAADDVDLTTVGDDEVHTLVHHWQQLNPVTTEALVLLTLGAPQHLYNGGLQFGRLRYWDLGRGRPGLPRDVSALVTRLTSDMTVVKLCNVSLQEERRLVVQAGAFGEHSFGRVRFTRRAGDDTGPVGRYTAPDVRTEPDEVVVGGPLLSVVLPPAHSITLELETQRNVNMPRHAPEGLGALFAEACTG